MLNSRMWISLCCTIAVVFLIMSLGVFENSNSFKGYKETNKEIKLIPHAENVTNVDNAAFLYFMLGAQGNQMNTQASIESLVKVAGWGGKVYVVVDRSDCIDEAAILRDSGILPNNLRMVRVDESFGGLTLDLRRADWGLSLNRYRSWAMRSRIFELVEDRSVEVVAHVDSDTLFGIEGCATEFVSSGPAWSEAGIHLSHLTRDTGGRLTGVHLGTFVVHREHSAQLLALWGAEMRKEHNQGVQNYGDCDAFMRVYAEQEQAHTLLLRTSSSSSAGRNPLEAANIFLHNDSATPFERFYPYTRGEGGHLSCILHLSKKRCDTHSAQIQHLVDRFALQTYRRRGGGEHPYCVQSALKHVFLYGWFPVAYIPFCPKLEHYS